MKVILDTNVFISGVFFSGPPYRILQAWRDGRLELCLSFDILDEYCRVAEVLAEQFPSINLQKILEYVRTHSTIYDAPVLSERVCEDSDDDKFLACALASGVKIIVSGDKHLLRVSGYQDIEVFKPKAFLDAYLT